MAIGNEQVIVAICDACGKRTYGEPGQQPAVLSGKVKDLTRNDELNVDWSACGAGHVGGAVKNVIAAARDKAKVTRGTFGSSSYTPGAATG